MSFWRRRDRPELLWRVNLPFSLVGNAPPVHDALTDAFLCGNGWGARYSDCRLHRIRASDGLGAGSAKVGDLVASLMFSPDGQSILVATSRRLIQVNRRTLELVGQWRDGVPRYSHYGLWLQEGVVLKNHLAPSLSLYNLSTSQCSRKHVGSCWGLFATEDGTVLVCGAKEGVIWRFDPATKKVSTAMSPGQFRSAAFDPHRNVIAIGMGDPYRDSSTSLQYYHDSRSLRIYSVSERELMVEARRPAPFELVKLLPGSNRIFLAQGSRVEICAIERDTVIDLGAFQLPDRLQVWSVYPERNVVLGASFVTERPVLAAFKLPTFRGPRVSRESSVPCRPSRTIARWA